VLEGCEEFVELREVGRDRHPEGFQFPHSILELILQMQRRHID
jgi:hypothetical protein